MMLYYVQPTDIWFAPCQEGLVFAWQGVFDTRDEMIYSECY